MAPDTPPQTHKISRRGLARRGLLAGGLALGGVAAARWFTGAGDIADDALSVQDAHTGAVAGSITLIDIRRPDEWARTGIGEGAVPLDMRRRDFTQALLAEVDGDPSAPIALICARGVRSRRLSGQLAAAGFSRVSDVPEGMLGSHAGPGWISAGLPTRPL